MQIAGVKGRGEGRGRYVIYVIMAQCVRKSKCDLPISAIILLLGYSI